MLTGEGERRRGQGHRRQFFTLLPQVRAQESPPPRNLTWRWMRGRERQHGSQDSCPMTLGTHALGGGLWGHVNTEAPVLTPPPRPHLIFLTLSYVWPHMFSSLLSSIISFFLQVNLVAKLFHLLQNKISCDKHSWQSMTTIPFLLGRKAMTNIDRILKSRDITFLTKFCIVKAMVFPVARYGCES